MCRAILGTAAGIRCAHVGEAQISVRTPKEHFMKLEMLAIMSVLAALLVFGVSLDAETSTTQPGQQVIDLPSFGVRFTVPAEYQRSPELRPTQLARFALVQGRQLQGLIEMELVESQTRMETAQKLATERGGKVLPTSVKWGAAALSVVEIPAPAGLKACRAYVVTGKKSQVVVFAATMDAASLQSVETSLAGSFTFSDPVPATQDLKLRKRPISLFGSGYLISLPEPFRPNEQTDKNQMSFIIPDGAANLQVVLAPNPRHDDLKQASAQIGALYAKQLGLPKPVAFTPNGNSPAVWVSEAFVAKINDQEIRFRMALFDFGGDRLAELVLVTGTNRQSEAFLEMFDRVAASVRFSKDYAQGAASVK